MKFVTGDDKLSIDYKSHGYSIDQFFQKLEKWDFYIK